MQTTKKEETNSLSIHQRGPVISVAFDSSHFAQSTFEGTRRRKRSLTADEKY